MLDIVKLSMETGWMGEAIILLWPNRQNWLSQAINSMPVNHLIIILSSGFIGLRLEVGDVEECNYTETILYVWLFRNQIVYRVYFGMTEIRVK